ncbi:MAG: nuclease superfamily protein [Pedosphaera sp.]|nr:nuclease superfamily protein [Pedosphaera sp.]
MPPTNNSLTSQPKKQQPFTYVYILQSIPAPTHFYTGITDDLTDRLKRHNRGSVPHTAERIPWRINTALAFTGQARAANFERYLKSPSGRAFEKKRL